VGKYIFRIFIQVNGVSKAKGYGLHGRGSIAGRGKIFLFSTACRLTSRPAQPPIQWVPGAFSLGVKLTTHLHLLPRSRMVELYLHSLICLNGIVLNSIIVIQVNIL
jgi:hypothetical protein